MDEEKIEQTVEVSDRAQVGDITLIGKVQTVIQQRSEWQDIAWRFLARNRTPIAVVFALEVGLAFIFLRFRDLYLIPGWHWGMMAALLAAACWGWYSWGWLGRTRNKLVLTLIATLGLGGMFGWYTLQVALPQRFAAQHFGILLAELGEGADYRRTRQSREISGQVYEYLSQVIEREFDEAGGGSAAQTPGAAEYREVRLGRIGVIPDSGTAQTLGERLGADLVIWGQVLTSGPGVTTLRFQVLEATDKATNPDFPFILPVTTTSTDILLDLREVDVEGNPIDVKYEVSKHSTVLASTVLGLLAYLDRDFTTARRLLETAAETIAGEQSVSTSERGLSMLQYYLGRSNHFLGQGEKGQAWLLAAQELNPNEPAIPLSLAYGYHAQDLEQERDECLSRAFELIEVWLDSHPRDTLALYDRGIGNHLRKEYQLEIADYKVILDIAPDFYIAYINLGRAYGELGLYEEAQQTLEQAIALADRTGANSSVAYLELAKISGRADEPDRARVAYLDAIEQDPGEAWNFYYFAQFLQAQQEYDAALMAYQNMLDVVDENYRGWAYEQIARLLVELGRLDEALEKYQRAVLEQPEDPLLRTELAKTYYSLGYKELAFREFEQAIALGSGIYYCYSSYAWTLYQEENYVQAAEMYEKSLALRPVGAHEMEYLALTYVYLGRCEDARQVYLQMISFGDHLSGDAIRHVQHAIEASGTCADRP